MTEDLLVPCGTPHKMATGLLASGATAGKHYLLEEISCYNAMRLEKLNGQERNFMQRFNARTVNI